RDAIQPGVLQSPAEDLAGVGGLEPSVQLEDLVVGEEGLHRAASAPLCGHPEYSPGADRAGRYAVGPTPSSTSKGGSMAETIAPHGGTLVNMLASGREAEQLA